MRKIFLVAMLFTSIITKAQVGIGTTTPNTSAALDIKDTTRGILIPRMKMLNRTAIQNPAEGLMVYQTDSIKGYWYYDGLAWKNFSSGSPSGNGGSPILVIADSITNAQAQAKIAAEFGTNTHDIRIVGCTNLTSVDLSMVTQAISINIYDNSVLQSVDLRNLVSCVGGDGIDIKRCALLTNVNLSSLQKVIGLYGYGLNLVGNTKIASLSLPALNKTTNITIQSNTLFASLSVPNLVTLGYLSISNNSTLPSLSFPALTTYGIAQSTSMYVSINSNLSSIGLNSLANTTNCITFQLAQNKLGSAQVNALLNKFVSITPALTGKQFNLNQQSPVAPPTGQGIIDKATLQSRGNTVNTD